MASNLISASDSLRRSDPRSVKLSPAPKSLPEGLEDSAQGFNPGNRPPGRRALKGRQIRRRRNGREEHIYLGAAIAPFCAGAHYFSHWEIVSLPNKYPLPFR